MITQSLCTSNNQNKNTKECFEKRESTSSTFSKHSLALVSKLFHSQISYQQEGVTIKTQTTPKYVNLFIDIFEANQTKDFCKIRGKNRKYVYNSFIISILFPEMTQIFSQSKDV